MLANTSWSELFPSGHCKYLRFEGPDHRPLINFFDPTKVKAKGVFRFDRSLRDKEEIHSLIANKWESREEEALFVKFGRCRRSLIQWAKEQLETKLQCIKELQEALETALSSPTPKNEEISLASPAI